MESLYRSYRPQTFADVVGQDHVVTTLERAITEGRTAHAYLFCGPRGTGKTTMARLLAKALLCDAGPGVLPDGSCEQCRLIAAGEHPDVLELDAASRTGVDNVREEIIASVAFAPVMGRAKVYIIDEVHMLTTAAFNALLKTLEEPPAHVTFVLCTTEPARVPETILSRVQRFDFHAIGMDGLVGRLTEVCEREGIAAEPEALALVARRARGGMRDALSSLEQLSVFGGGRVTLAAAEALLGGAGTDELAALSLALAARDVATLFSQVAAAADGGRDLLSLTRELAAHLRDVYVVAALAGDSALQAAAGEAGTGAVSQQPEAPDGFYSRYGRFSSDTGSMTQLDPAETSPDTRDDAEKSSIARIKSTEVPDAAALAAIAARVPVAALASTGDVVAIAREAVAFGSADRVARALAVLADASAEMRTAPNQRLVLEIALTRIVRPESDLTLEALADRVATLEAQVAALAQPRPQAQAAIAWNHATAGEGGAGIAAMAPATIPMAGGGDGVFGADLGIPAAAAPHAAADIDGSRPEVAPTDARSDVREAAMEGPRHADVDAGAAANGAGPETWEADLGMPAGAGHPAAHPQVGPVNDAARLDAPSAAGVPKPSVDAAARDRAFAVAADADARADAPTGVGAPTSVRADRPSAGSLDPAGQAAGSAQAVAAGRTLASAQAAESQRAAAPNRPPASSQVAGTAPRDAASPVQTAASAPSVRASGPAAGSLDPAAQAQAPAQAVAAGQVPEAAQAAGSAQAVVSGWAPASAQAAKSTSVQAGGVDADPTAPTPTAAAGPAPASPQAVGPTPARASGPAAGSPDHAAQAQAPAPTAVSGWAPASPQAAEAASAVTPLDPAELQRRWRQTVDALIAEAPARGSLLAASTLERDDGHTLLVTLPKGSNFAAKMLARPDVQAAIAPAVERAFGPRRLVYAEASLAEADIARADRAAAAAGPFDRSSAAAVPTSAAYQPVPAQTATGEPTVPTPGATAAAVPHERTTGYPAPAQTATASDIVAPASNPASGAAPAVHPAVNPSVPAQTTQASPSAAPDNAPLAAAPPAARPDAGSGSHRETVPLAPGAETNRDAEGSQRDRFPMAPPHAAPEPDPAPAWDDDDAPFDDSYEDAYYGALASGELGAGESSLVTAPTAPQNGAARAADEQAAPPASAPPAEDPAQVTVPIDAAAPTEPSGGYPLPWDEPPTAPESAPPIPEPPAAPAGDEASATPTDPAELPESQASVLALLTSVFGEGVTPKE